MKRATIVLLLTLAVSLGAVVNLGDEYIGSTPMGHFRKTGETFSYHYYYGGGGEHDTTSYTYYYYNECYPTRLDSIRTSSSNGWGGGGSKTYYEYEEFDDYYLATVSSYGWEDYFKGRDYELYSVCNYKYNHQDKKLEYQYTYGSPTLDKGVYTYDANGNLVLVNEYNTNVSETEPYRVTTYEYDDQNRLTHMQVLENQQIVEAKWQTWGDHPLPDSTYTIGRPNSGFDNKITKNYYDENGVRNAHVLMGKYRSESRWRRYDTIYSYTFAHGMAFPITANVSYGYVTDPDDPFEPITTYPRNYTCTNDYHNIDVSPTPFEQYIYDSNWLLTRISYANLETHGTTRTISWQYYGSTPNDDPTAVPQAIVSAYPNPAKGNVNISLSKSDVRAPVEAKIYNIKGQLVRNLQVNDLSSDQYHYNWNCKDFHSRDVPAGVYLIRIKTNSGEVGKKVTVLK